MRNALRIENIIAHLGLKAGMLDTPKWAILFYARNMEANTEL